MPAPVPATTFCLTVEREVDAHRLVGLSAHRLRMRRQRESDLRQLMEARGLNLIGLAARMAVSHSYVSRIISGSRTPSLRTTIDMARVLGLPLTEMASYLLPDTEVPHAPTIR